MLDWEKYKSSHGDDVRGYPLRKVRKEVFGKGRPQILVAQAVSAPLIPKLPQVLMIYAWYDFYIMEEYS